MSGYRVYYLKDNFAGSNQALKVHRPKEEPVYHRLMFSLIQSLKASGKAQRYAADPVSQTSGCRYPRSKRRYHPCEDQLKSDRASDPARKHETTHPDYLKEKSLYCTMIDDFNTAGFRNADGSLLNAEKMDALPQAYTRTEGQSLKNYADLLYGHYDEESKSLLCDTFIGSIFLQYKTYITAKLEQ